MQRSPGQTRPAARELSLLLRNHWWLPLAYQSHRTWLPRTSGTGCDLPPQPLLLLLTLTSKLLTALKATADFPAPVPLPCCPSAGRAPPAPLRLRGASAVAPHSRSGLRPPPAPASFPAPWPVCSPVWPDLPARLTSPSRLWPLRAVTVPSSPFTFAPLPWLSTPLKALSRVCEMHLEGAGLQRTRASGARRRWQGPGRVLGRGSTGEVLG